MNIWQTAVWSSLEMAKLILAKVKVLKQCASSLGLAEKQWEGNFLLQYSFLVNLVPIWWYQIW